MIGWMDVIPLVLSEEKNRKTSLADNNACQAADLAALSRTEDTA